MTRPFTLTFDGKEEGVAKFLLAILFLMREYGLSVGDVQKIIFAGVSARRDLFAPRAIDKVFQLIKDDGGRRSLAKRFGVSVQAVAKWRACVPADNVIAISGAVGFKVTPHELRPDLYPHPDDGLPVGLRQIGTEQAAA